MKRLLLAVAFLLLASRAFAQTEVEYLSLNNCTTGGTPCSASNVWKLSNVYVHLDETAGTLIADVECQLTPGDSWLLVSAAADNLADDAFVAVPMRCYQLRINPGTCTACSFTATVTGHLPR